ncbi:hypothetical protein EMCRGX_G003838 [Ephydatia muelleri]
MMPRFRAQMAYELSEGTLYPLQTFKKSIDNPESDSSSVDDTDLAAGAILVPDFKNNPDQDDIFATPWEKEHYLKYFPRQTRPSDRHSPFKRTLIRQIVKELEQLQKVNANWPLENLLDVAYEIEYYLMGLESDVKRQLSLLLSSVNKHIVWPERRKEELLLEAGVYMNARRDVLDGQLRELNETITQLRDIGETAEGILMDEETLLECHEEVEKAIDDKLEECRKLKIKPAADASNAGISVEVISVNELAALVKAQCRIISQAETFTSSNVVDGIPPTVDLLCATPATVTISNGIQGTSSKADVRVHFKPVTAYGECDLYETSSGVFEFIYCGTRRGQHRLSMEVNGKHLGHFSVLVTLPPNRLGKLVRVIEPVYCPTSIAIASNNLLFVNESGRFPRLAVMDRFVFY